MVLLFQADCEEQLSRSAPLDCGIVQPPMGRSSSDRTARRPLAAAANLRQSHTLPGKSSLSLVVQISVDATESEMSSSSEDFGADVEELLFKPETRHSSDTLKKNILSVEPDEYARQITLIDLEIFKKIRTAELMGNAWMKKDKFTIAPNVVEITRRFNHLSLWVVREILKPQTKPSGRLDVLKLFIKIAKHLRKLNNIHSLIAVLSALRSAPIYRLHRTWDQLPRKSQAVFNKLTSFVSTDCNYQELREHLKTTKLPCLPYLGMYLTDLVHVGLGKGKDSSTINVQALEMIHFILNFQHSLYEFPTFKIIQEYILAVKYQEELRKFVEDENFKLSLAIEPREMPVQRNVSPAKSPATTPLKSGSEGNEVGSRVLRPSLAPAQTKPSKSKAKALMTLPNRVNQLGSEFKKGHRKTRSLGTTMSLFWAGGGADVKEPKAGATLTEPSPSNRSVGKKRSSYNMLDADTCESSDGSSSNSGVSDCSDFVDLPAMDPLTEPNRQEGEADTVGTHAAADSGPEPTPVVGGYTVMEGVLQRKSESRLRGFRRQWAVLLPTEIIFFKKRKGAKGSKNERSWYREDKGKRHPLAGCHVAEDRSDKRKFVVKLREGKAISLKTTTAQDREIWTAKLKSEGPGKKETMKVPGRVSSNAEGAPQSPLRAEWSGNQGVKASKSHDGVIPIRENSAPS